MYKKDKEEFSKIKEFISRDIGLSTRELNYDRIKFWIGAISNVDLDFLTRDENRSFKDALKEILSDKRVVDAAIKIGKSEDLVCALTLLQEKLENIDHKNIEYIKEAIFKDMGVSKDKVDYDKFKSWLNKVVNLNSYFYVENPAFMAALNEVLTDPRFPDSSTSFRIDTEMDFIHDELEKAELAIKALSNDEALVTEGIIGLIECDKSLAAGIVGEMSIFPDEAMQKIFSADDFEIESSLAANQNLPKRYQEHLASLDEPNYYAKLLENDCDIDVAEKIIYHVGVDSTFVDDAKAMTDIGNIISEYCERNREAILDCSGTNFLYSLDVFNDAYKATTLSNNDSIDDLTKELTEQEIGLIIE